MRMVVELTLVISDPSTGKAIQRKVGEEKAEALIGKRIGDVIEGSLLGLPDSKLQITGGTDRDGFPMRWDVHGPVKKRVLISSGPGLRPKERGERRRKTVRGDAISEEIQQVNLKILEVRDKRGMKSVFQKFFEKKKGKGGG